MGQIVLEMNEWQKVARKAYGFIPMFSRHNFDKEFSYTINFEVITDLTDPNYGSIFYVKKIIVYLDFEDENQELLFRLKRL